MTPTGTRSPPARRADAPDRGASPTRAPIDPRIRARRREVQRTEGRKRLHRIGLLASGACVLGFVWWLTLTPLLDVDAISVRGAEHTGEHAVLAALGIHRGDALLTADIGGAARALSELPWVATSSVRRSWPGTVRVAIVERVAVAAIAARGGGWVVVDAGGRQLAVEKEPLIELTRIAGRPLAAHPGSAAGDAYQGAIDLSAALPPPLRSAIASLWIKRGGAIEAGVRLPGGADVVVLFGAPDQLESKLVSLAALIERADLARVRIIDLRVPSAPALTRG